MKKVLLLSIILLTQACTHSYYINVEKPIKRENVAKLNFSNFFKITKVDGKPFNLKFGTPDTQHVMYLTPGEHTISTRYNSRTTGGFNPSVGYVLKKEARVNHYFEAGKEYRFMVKIDPIWNKISFYFKDLSENND